MDVRMDQHAPSTDDKGRNDENLLLSRRLELQDQRRRHKQNNKVGRNVARRDSESNRRKGNANTPGDGRVPQLLDGDAHGDAGHNGRHSPQDGEDSHSPADPAEASRVEYGHV